MRKLIITENEKKNILGKHYGYFNSDLFEYLQSIFKISSDIQFHELTQGRTEMVTFIGKIQDIYGDEIEETFVFRNNKDELKKRIVNFVKDDPKIYHLLQAKGIRELIKLLRNAQTEEEKDFYSEELANQMKIYYNNIDAPLNKTVKDFINFYIR